jgi:AAHS family 4-hydroxybenzoate transporter-like MFS transporter
VPLTALFSDGRGFLTAMLWVMFFASLFELYFVSNWLVLLLHEGGVGVRNAVMISSLFQVGGTVGMLLLGTLIDRYRPFVVLAATYLAAALCIGLVGVFLGGSVMAIMVAVFCAGFCVVGAQIGANAMAARAYPTAIRATGVGSALGVGRIGSIIGPVLGGAFLALQWSPAGVLALGIIPMLVAALAAAAIHLHAPRLSANAGERQAIT